MKRYSISGVITSILFALLPFATSRHLFHAAVNVKYFLIIAAVLGLATLGVWALWNGKHIFAFRKRPLLWTGAALLGIYWLAALTGVFPERSIFADIQRSSGVFFLTHIALLALILGEFFREQDWQLVRRTIAISAATFAFFTLLGIEGLGISGRLLWTNLDINGYTFGNTTFAGTYLLLALIVALIELSRTTARTKWRTIMLGSSALITFSPVLFNIGILWGKTALIDVFSNPILLLGSARASSATALLLLIFFCGYLLLNKYAGSFRKKAIGASAATFILAIFVGVALLFTPGSTIQEKYIETSSAARILVWEGGLAAFTERPVLGWGPENFGQAMQNHLDNRLYEDQNYGEIWFDRAHNILVDTLVDAGLVGALALLTIAGVFIRVVYKARGRGLIEEGEAVILFALPFAHFLQLQTGFDTIGSFAILGVFGGYALWLERALHSANQKKIASDTSYYKAGAVALGLFIVTSAYILTVEINRQSALYKIFVTTDSARQLMFAQKATERLSSFESLRLSSGSLLKGTLESIANGKASRETIDGALSQIHVYEERYLRYLEAQPENLRARMNLAYLYSVQTVLGENKLSEAREVIANARELAPQSLVTPAMEALIELYSGNLKLAKAKAEEIVALNPNASFGREVLAHIEKQEKTFPNITVLKLENL